MTNSLRQFSMDDLPALVAVINRAAEADREDSFTTLDALRNRFERPYFYPEHNCLVAVTDGGEIVGYVTTELDPRFGKGWGTGCVDPAWRGQGIGRALIEAADVRHLEQVEHDLFYPETGLYVTRVCRDTNTPTRALLEADGYAIWRISWVMHIDLAVALPESPLPDGFALRPFEPERDARLVWELEGEIFHDAPGYAQPPFEVWETFMFPAGHDDALWLLAVDQRAAGEPVAGLCLCRPKHDAPATGWVELFGVRQPHRGQGLGLALLRQGLRAMQAHGFSTAELDVDSENKTNAVALYERGGMTVSRCYLVYRKIFREPAPV
ncbi:MAG: GNAT family N-acetyltransferase [Anaerolineae bacterium]|nr:GNAT family N-acetyltransferase [Anaerolineae bacterium]